MSNYKVGYGRPPKSKQFKKGTSGNPSGRPRGSLNLATDLASELTERITVREDGHSRKVSKQRALIKSLMAKALSGDVRAMLAIFALLGRVANDVSDDQDQPLSADELQVLRRFAPRLIKSIKEK
jgi:hypothetical protein